MSDCLRRAHFCLAIGLFLREAGIDGEISRLRVTPRPIVVQKVRTVGKDGANWLVSDIIHRRQFLLLLRLAHRHRRLLRQLECRLDLVRLDVSDRGLRSLLVDGVDAVRKSQLLWRQIRLVLFVIRLRIHDTLALPRRVVIITRHEQRRTCFILDVRASSIVTWLCAKAAGHLLTRASNDRCLRRQG